MLHRCCSSPGCPPRHSCCPAGPHQLASFRTFLGWNRLPHDQSPVRCRLPVQIGFVSLLLLELIAGQGILNLLGVTVGKGLGFEF